MAHSERDTEAQSFVAALIQGLQESGWSNGKNVRIDIRWSAGDVERMRVRADIAPPVENQRRAAVADGAEEHRQSESSRVVES